MPKASSAQLLWSPWASAPASEPLPGPTWRMEEDVQVVQVDRTISWGPRFGWITAGDGSLDLQITVYSSSAPPFGLNARVSVKTDERVMTYSEILDAAGVTPSSGRG